MTKGELLDKANSLPLTPGVYLMKNAGHEVIYVGKAKRLKNRVSQYFQSGSGHDFKTHVMVGQVHDFDTILVPSEAGWRPATPWRRSGPPSSCPPAPTSSPGT